jgi:hypothetical protein
LFVSILSLIYMRDIVHAQKQVLFFIRRLRKKTVLLLDTGMSSTVSLFIPQSPTFPTPLPVTICQILRSIVTTEPTREVCNGDPTSSHRANLLDLGWWATLSLDGACYSCIRWNTTAKKLLAAVDYEEPWQVAILPGSLKKLVKNIFISDLDSMKAGRCRIIDHRLFCR